MHAKPLPAQRTSTRHSAQQHTHGHNSKDEAELLRAIQALDSLRDCRGERASRSTIVRVFNAWAYFLELATRLEYSEDNKSHRHDLLVLESRVLGCVTRFLPALHAKGPSDRTEKDSNTRVFQRCSPGARGGCVEGALKSAVACFLYMLCRHKSTAVLVVRSGLRCWLLQECRSLSPLSSHATNAEIERTMDAKDVLIAVDPFDWACAALHASLTREGASCAVFRVPIGPRSLSHVFRQHPLPRNESEELNIQLQAPSSPVKLTTGLKPHRLPSIFYFPTRVNGPIFYEDKPCVVCCPRFDTTAWTAIASEATRLHFAVRAVVAMVLSLSPSSPEHKIINEEGVHDALHRIAFQHGDCPDEEATQEARTTNEHDPLESEAELGVIREMAAAGLRVIAPSPVLDEQSTSPHHRQAARSPVKGAKIASPGDRFDRSPLKEKLHTITSESRRYVAQRQREELARQQDLERAALRHRVRDLYRSAMETRDDLIRSLAVMSTGRPHPAAGSQSIVDWLDSFMTIEKKEQQRQEQEAMRQRRLIELQFQIDERRRRERDERALMAVNDYDTPNTSEQSKAEAKRAEFRRVQLELHELQLKEEEERRKQTDTVMLEKKREAAQLEARRQQAIAEESRRQVKENESMKKEDTYYVDKILREKQQREQQARQAKAVDPIVEQQKRIEQMRKQDSEKKRCEKESEWMRGEDLLARQRRFMEAEAHRQQLERERKARKTMEAEERWLRVQWKRIDEMMEKQRKEQEKQRRADERRARREQEQQWKAWQAAWISLYDASGNLYYYNQLTGESQWTNPLDSTESYATTDAADSWPGTSSQPLSSHWY